MAFKYKHPKIHYWFWDEETVADKKYLKDIDTLAGKSDFDMLFISQRGSLNLWDSKTYGPIFAEMVEYAHERGIKVGLQLWPNGSFAASYVEVSVDDAEAVVTEYEAQLGEGELIIDAHGKNVRSLDSSVPIKSELLCAMAFKKTGEGFYEEGSLTEITKDVESLPDSEDLQAVTLKINRPDLAGYTVYVMGAHYYRIFDMFTQGHQNEYAKIMEAYSDIPFDGFGLDEFKHILLENPNKPGVLIRERFYGKHFAKAFREQKGEDIVKTMFEMRFCPQGMDEIRIKAINNYWDVLRPSTVPVERFVEKQARKVFGEDMFMGVHNTFHNQLQNDELWATGCSWWDVPRRYAQTDEDIPYPVRAGMSCCCKESIVYDMYYHPKEEAFFEKAVRDARYNSRIHYHAMNDGHFGVDTGSPEFLAKIGKIESKINLLNMFDTKQPKMELLVVFGFPALCNWYPKYDERNHMDINGKIDIMGRTHRLWTNGYFNALAPSDAVEDGRIKIEDGGFDFCGHKFKKLLYLYPEYSKPAVVSFLNDVAKQGIDMKVIGGFSRGFDGKPAEFDFGREYFLEEDADIAKAMNLDRNTIENGCITEDGAIVISDYDSVMNDSFCTYEFELEGCKFEAQFRGTFALKLDGEGNLEKCVAGNLKYLKKNGVTLVETEGIEDYLKI